MKIWIIGAMALLAAAPSMAPAAPKTAKAVIVKFVGGVDHQNAMIFLKSLRDQSGKVVGLKIHVEPGDDRRFPGADYRAAEDEDQFVVSKTQPEFGDGLEMRAPDGDVGWRQGEYVLDGFYRVKNGGIHQGVTSVSLEKIDETTAFLRAKSKVVERPIE